MNDDTDNKIAALQAKLDATHELVRLLCNAPAIRSWAREQERLAADRARNERCAGWFKLRAIERLAALEAWPNDRARSTLLESLDPKYAAAWVRELGDQAGRAAKFFDEPERQRIAIFTDDTIKCVTLSCTSGAWESEGVFDRDGFPIEDDWAFQRIRIPASPDHIVISRESLKARLERNDPGGELAHLIKAARVVVHEADPFQEANVRQTMISQGKLMLGAGFELVPSHLVDNGARGSKIVPISSAPRFEPYRAPTMAERQAEFAESQAAATRMQERVRDENAKRLARAVVAEMKADSAKVAPAKVEAPKVFNFQPGHGFGQGAAFAVQPEVTPSQTYALDIGPGLDVGQLADDQEISNGK